MPYININEYDYTITGPKSIGGNIVAIPINASDGPSDRWVTVHTYDDFVQLFSTDPNPSGDFGSSWQYAANLLLRNMSVCVRRITHTLDDEGINKELLPGVSIAKAIIKLKDTQSDSTGSTTGLDENVIDLSNVPNIGLTKLILSDAGRLDKNPLYKTNDNTVEGETKSDLFKNPLALEAATLDVKPKTIIVNGEQQILSKEETGTFADVSCTNSEWDYIGRTHNSHHKFNGDDPTDNVQMSWIIENNPAGVLGDFYVNEDGHVVAYSEVSIKNENQMAEGSKTYPSQLATLNTKNLTTASFIEVKYDKTNKNIANVVWTYSPTETTTVTNHNFIVPPTIEYGTNGVFKSETKLKEFANNSAYKSSLATGNFAVVDKKDKIYTYRSDVAAFGASDISTDNINTPGTYGKEITINFVTSGIAINTGIYRREYNWKNTGESGEVDNGWEKAYHDERYPELVFTKYIHWENSNRLIGSTPHQTIVGATRNINKITINENSNLTNTNINVSVVTNEENKVKTNFQSQVISDTDEKRLTSGVVGFTNNGTSVLNLYSFKITQTGSKTIYDMGLESIKSANDPLGKDSLLVLKDADGNVKELPIAKTLTAYDNAKYFIEIPVGYSLYYNANVSNATLELEVTGSDDIELDVHLFKSNEGEYDLRFTSMSGGYVTCKRYSLPDVDVIETIDYNNYPVDDGRGNINMFKVEYLYPGSNGNQINVKLQTLQNRGIFLLVYRNNQFLEQIELCNFRYRLGNNRVITLDLELNKVEMWNTLLSNFGIRVDLATGMFDANKSSIRPIVGKYVSVYFNENIITKGLNTLDYITLLYGQIKQGISNSNTFNLQTGKDPSDEHVKHEVPNCYEPLKDKYRYDVTFVSNGGYVDDIIYPNEITKYYNNVGSAYRLIEDSMLSLAESRKDCVAFLDVPYDLPMESVPSYFSHISTSYAAAYDPWGLTTLETGATKWMPPSFVQLYTHAKSIMNGNKMYLPPAGVRRAQATEVIKTSHELPSKYIKEWQDSDTPQFINPIIWINGYDYTIYGQKTLFSVVSASEKYQSALQDLNVRLVANEVKKLIWATCINLTFELNTLMTWNEFRAKMEPTLSTMLGEGTLTDYEVIMDSTTMTQADLNSGHVCGTVRISVARAATDWDINFEITPNNVTFNEIDYGSTYSE